MKALILAAGYATRLYPLTKNTPKPLLQVGKKKVIEYIINNLEEVKDIDQILIVTNAKFYSTFCDWLKTHDSIKPIKIINDSTTNNVDRLGALGDIEYVVKHESIQDDLLVIAGDNLFEFQLSNFVDYFKLNSNSVIALCDLKDKNKIKNKFGCVEIKKNRIISFEEKPNEPKSSLVAIACYVYSKSHVFSLFRNNSKQHFENIEGIMGNFIDKKELNGYIFSERWVDIGSFDSLEKARKRYS